MQQKCQDQRRAERSLERLQNGEQQIAQDCGGRDEEGAAVETGVRHGAVRTFNRPSLCALPRRSMKHRHRGEAVPCSEASLRSAERVSTDGHPGLARAGLRSAMCPAAAGGAHANSRSSSLTSVAISGTLAGFWITRCTPTAAARRASAGSMQPLAMTTGASARMASTACASSSPLMPPGIVRSVRTRVNARGSRSNAASASCASEKPRDAMPSFSSARVRRKTSAGSSST